jgi:hypothetical protein
MMRFLLCVLCLLWIASVTGPSVLGWSVTAQDAVRILPDNYKVAFENEYVRVTRVHYGPHAKLPGHTHTSLASAYVYLNDSGPVAFKHVGAAYGAVTRKPTKARSYRLYRGIDEIHEVENLSPLPSDFLRVEFKTDPVDPPTLRGVFLSPAPATKASERLEFENAQLRVSRFLAPPGRSIVVTAADRPSVLLSLSAGEEGSVAWLDKGRSHLIADATGGPVETLRFLLKTEVPTR